MHPDALQHDAAGAPVGPDPETDTFRLFLDATNDAVRNTIQRISGHLGAFPVAEEDCDLIEIVLAEILNNVVEHAYVDMETGGIEIIVDYQPPFVQFTIWDDGREMPAGRLPGGESADPGRAGHEQAEGGYGLFMIRQLARKLRYERIGDRNRLSFRVTMKET